MIPNSSPFSTGDKVVAYCRYSEGDEQELRNTSTEEQEAAIRQFCDQHGLILTQVFADPFASGRSVAKRDKYLEMLSFLLHGKKKKDIAGVILWDYERYGRNYDRAQYDAAQLRMKGYKLFSMQQPITDNSPFAHVLESMYFASAQNQSDMISADVKRALQSNFVKYKVVPRSCIALGWKPVSVDMGFLSDGRPRTGYRAEPDPVLKPRIQDAISKRFRGATLDEMKEIIGGPFENRPREYVRRLMTRPLLYGQMTYGGTTMDDYCEPIIDKETFDRLQVYNKTAPNPNYKPVGHYSDDRPMLSDMCYCGICGKKAFLNRRKTKGKMYETYYCNDKHVGFRKEILEGLVIEKGIEMLSEKQFKRDVKCVLDSAEPRFPGAQDNSAYIAEIAEIDRKIARISSVLEESDDAPVSLVKRLSDLEKRRTQLTKWITPVDEKTAKRNLIDEMDEIRLNIIGVLQSEKSTADDLRNALSLFVDSVVIYPEGRVLIRHTLPGMTKVASKVSRLVTAPPAETWLYSQLFEVWCVI